jgi:hypothetical protein
MKYLVKGERIVSTENWEERHTHYEKVYDEEGEKLIAITQSIEEFAKENGFTIVNEKPTELSKQELNLQYENELVNIKHWFNQNDWRINKIALGEWETTDSRWTTYLEERKIKRARQDEIENLIKK